MTTRPPGPLLFQPFKIRDLELKNRIVISPMCQHAADYGKATDWHLVHLGKFALGGAGLIFVESTSIDPRARIGVDDIGLWSDDHIEPFRRVIDFVHRYDSKIGVQLAHAGRKSGLLPLDEGGRALTLDEMAATGQPWTRVGPSALSAGPAWTVAEAMSLDDIRFARNAYVEATRRAVAAGFDALELHFAHGYLVASFLSPKANVREDEYGGSRENRMRLAIEVARDVRQAWPQERPLFVRISAVDGAVGGWDMDDSVALVHELRKVGVDVVDCSSGGVIEDAAAPSTVPRGLGFQVPFAARIRAETGVATQAIGLILDGPQAEAILQAGQADLIAIAREALADPYWPLHQARAMGWDTDYGLWNFRHRKWLEKRGMNAGFSSLSR